MNAYDLQSWVAFLAAVVGAGTALAGLIFVALSINLDRLLHLPNLAARAGETLATLILAVIGAALGLLPQHVEAYGIELIALTVPVWLTTLALQIRQGPDSDDDPTWWFASRVAVTQSVALPFIVTGISLVVGTGGGIFWLAGGALAAVAGAVYNGWILLVEVVRNDRGLERLQQANDPGGD